MRNEKGFTLVEILVVIAIIAILFVTLLPQIDNAVKRSRETGVKTDFHTLQTAMETYMRETGGNDIKPAGLTNYLDPGMAPKAHNNGAYGLGLDLTKKDPWGKEYDVYIIPDQKVIVIRSFGPDEIAEGMGIESKDDYFLATYYYQGQVGSCTAGFDTNNIITSILGTFEESLAKCGRKSPTNVDLETQAVWNTL